MRASYRAVRASPIGRAGLVLLVIGLFLEAYVLAFGPTPQARLTLVEGKLTQAAQVSRAEANNSNEGGSDFVLTIAPPRGGAPVRLTIPAETIDRARILDLIDRPVTAEYDGVHEVYALSSLGQEIVAYETTRRLRAARMQDWAERGRILIILAVPLALLALFRAHRHGPG